MASTFQQNMVIYKAGAAISKGMVVKFDTSDDHVIKAALATNSLIGIAQTAATTAEDLVEVALPGGGAKGLSGGVITRGALLTSDTSGKLVSTTSTADRIIGVALASAAADDLFDVMVVAGAY